MTWRGEIVTQKAAFPAIVIECVTPVVDGGRYPVKRVIGEQLEVGADIFKDGHDLLSAQVLYRGPGDTGWHAAPLRFVYDDDRWYGAVPLDRIGPWRFTIEAWVDAFATWRTELEKKFAAGQSVDSELLEGAELVHQASRHARGESRDALDAAAAQLAAAGHPAAS
ncbi:MAG TPA: maltotransferase domain-containing protein, partial [Gemmatimonadales bacterium]|nr:maltotransferase domain-containing protein [Gemmatimonadales bacterium]